MRLFGSERVMNMMETLGVDEDTPLDNKMLSNAIEQAQKTVESRNFETRKSVLEFDDVMNQQRNLIYDERRKVLEGEDLRAQIMSMVRDYITASLNTSIEGGVADNQQQIDEGVAPLEKLFLPHGVIKMEEYSGEVTVEELTDSIAMIAEEVYNKKENDFGLDPNGTPIMREIERVVMLRVVDEYWMDHIDAMDALKRDVRLRAYANEKPIDAYKRDGYDMFEEMIDGIRSETVRRMYTVQVRKEQQIQRKSVARATTATGGGDGTVKKQPVKKVKKPGRNDPCPCGKMKEDGSRPLKYKECCGRFEK